MQLVRFSSLPKWLVTNCLTALQHQFAQESPTACGLSCTAAFRVACSSCPRAGGDHPSVQRQQPWALPQQSQPTSRRQCVGPAQASLPLWTPAIPVPIATKHASVPVPVALVSGTCALAHLTNPSVTAPMQQRSRSFSTSHSVSSKCRATALHSTPTLRVSLRYHSRD